jgi:hypothetical protein
MTCAPGSRRSALLWRAGVVFSAEKMREMGFDGNAFLR